MRYATFALLVALGADDRTAPSRSPSLQGTTLVSVHPTLPPPFVPTPNPGDPHMTFHGGPKRPEAKHRISSEAVGLACAVSAALLAPAALYLWFIFHFGVNVPFQDTWNGTLPLLRDYARGTLTLAALWAPHNENRMLVPNALLVLLDDATRMNAVVDMVVGAILWVTSTLLLILLARRTLGLGWAWLIPVPWVLLSFVQVENTLWAFQFAWMLILLLTVGVLLIIEFAPTNWGWFGVAAGLAILASLSSLQGLLVWPVGLVYGVGCGWNRRRWSTWLVAGVATTALYGWDFGPVQPRPQPAFLLTHPLDFTRFFVELVGGMFVYHHGPLALVLLLLLAGAGVSALRYRQGWARFRLPLALVVAGILFDLLVTEGRAPFGLTSALSSRYTTYNLVLLTGAYLAAVGIANSPSSLAEFERLLRRRPLEALLVVVGCTLVILQIWWGLPNGLHQGKVYLVNRTIGAHLLRNYRAESAAKLGLYLFYPEGEYVKAWAPVLARHHWSVFSSNS